MKVIYNVDSYFILLPLSVSYFSDATIKCYVQEQLTEHWACLDFCFQRVEFMIMEKLG